MSGEFAMNGGEAVIDRWMRTRLVMEEEQIWTAKVKLAGKVMYLVRILGFRQYWGLDNTTIDLLEYNGILARFSVEDR